MAPRPDGTDGSDFTYREVIEDRYKRMAVYMSATYFLMRVQTFAVLLKTAWHTIPWFLDDELPKLYAFGIFGLEVVANFAFYFGSPGKRNILPLMKTTAICLLFMLITHFVTLYKYHSLDPKYQLYPRRVFKFLKDSRGVESEAWLNSFTVLEAALDCLQFITLGFCFYTLHTWVTDAMDTLKERAAREGPKALATKPPASAMKKRR